MVCAWCGVWSVVFGLWCVCVWCVVCGVWCVVWCVVCGVWSVGCAWCGVWSVVFGVWGVCVVCGVCIGGVESLQEALWPRGGAAKGRNRRTRNRKLGADPAELSPVRRLPGALRAVRRAAAHGGV